MFPRNIFLVSHMNNLWCKWFSVKNQVWKLMFLIKCICVYAKRNTFFQFKNAFEVQVKSLIWVIIFGRPIMAEKSSAANRNLKTLRSLSWRVIILQVWAPNKNYILWQKIIIMFEKKVLVSGKLQTHDSK